MMQGKKIVCILPAYNAARTLERTLAAVPSGIVDQYVLVDDASHDETFAVAARLADAYPLVTLRHAENRGYGGNQKTCYAKALELGADIVVMLHPDYQYEPKLLGALADLVASGVYDVALGSRVLGKGALVGGMPLYKYVANRLLTLIENLCLKQKISEYHTGYRAFSREVLETLPLEENSDNFVFDNEVLVQSCLAGFRIGEMAVPTKYFPEASSISFKDSVVYGVAVLSCSLQGWLGRMGLPRSARFRVTRRDTARNP